MIGSSFKLVLVASAVAGVDQKMAALFEENRSELVVAILKLFSQEISAETVFHFELELEVIGKKLLRRIMEMTLNQIEPADPEEMPKIIRWESGQYRRENEKSPNRYVATRFGNITLWRFRYRFRQRESEPAVFPLEIRLGLVGGATPAFADTVAQYMAPDRLSRGPEQLRAGIEAEPWAFVGREPIELSRAPYLNPQGELASAPMTLRVFAAATADGYRLMPGGLAELQQRNHRLAVEARRMLCEQWKVETICPESMLGTMATVRLPNVSAEAAAKLANEREQTHPTPCDPWIGRLLFESRIDVPVFEWNQQRFLRVSAHAYNHRDQYRKLASAVTALATES